MISYNKASLIIKKIAKTNVINNIEQIKVKNSCNRINARSYYSNFNMPIFRNSAMDGFTLNKNILHKIKNNLIININGIIYAGIYKKNIYKKEFIYEIMTGAIIPDIYNCIIPKEEIKITKIKKGIIKEIEILFSLQRKNHIRNIGEDFKKNQIILKINKYITPSHILVLTNNGYKNILVYKKPIIGILSTGNEIEKESLINNYFAQHGLINNANIPYIIASLKRYNINIKYYGNIKDNTNNLLNNIINILKECNVIITTGGVSVGKYDFIHKIISLLNGSFFFHGVKIKPGKPILMASVGKSIFWGLPGNPVAVVIGLKFFIIPYLQKISNQVLQKIYFSLLLRDFRKKKTLTLFLKSKIYKNKILILKRQESFATMEFLNSNGLSIFESNNEYLNRGDIIKIIFNNNIM